MSQSSPQSSNAAAHCINPDCARPTIRSLAARSCPTCGTTLRLHDRYIPIVQLSSNRNTATYRVYDLKARCEAVLKVLLETTPQNVESFRHAAKVLSSMRHLGLPRVEVGGYFQVPLRASVHSLPCFVMEHIPGKSLQAMIDSYPKGCPEGWVLDWLKQAVETLQFLHSRDIVHHHLTPENLLLHEDTDRVVMIGFGITKPSSLQGSKPQSEVRSWSQAYKPERSGGEGDTSADFYALGRICIHLLTGVHPSSLEGKGGSRWRHRARVSPAFADLLDKLTHPQASSRPKVAEIKTMLAQLSVRRRTGAGAHSRKQGKLRPITLPHLPVARIIQDLEEIAFQFPVMMRSLVLTLWAMARVGGTSAIAASCGFWLIFYSPVSQTVQQALSPALARSLHLPFMPNPAMLLFTIAGLYQLKKYPLQIVHREYNPILLGKRPSAIVASVIPA